MVRNHIAANSHEIHCLAEAVYHEARGEPAKGQETVAQVVLNRTQFGTEFGNTVCKVVYQPKQFSWTSRERLSYTRHQHNDQFKAIEQRAVVWIVEFNSGIAIAPEHLRNATFFSVGRPYAHHLKYDGRIGRQKFYSDSEYVVDIQQPQDNSEAYNVF